MQMAKQKRIVDFIRVATNKEVNKVRSSNSQIAYKSGKPVRRGNHRTSGKRLGVDFRPEVHIERPVDPRCTDVGDWLATFTRKNRSLKDTRNVGGLALTYVESGIITKSLYEKYDDYGKNFQQTERIHRRLEEEFADFVKEAALLGG